MIDLGGQGALALKYLAVDQPALLGGGADVMVAPSSGPGSVADGRRREGTAGMARPFQPFVLNGKSVGIPAGDLRRRPRSLGQQSA